MTIEQPPRHTSTLVTGSARHRRRLRNYLLDAGLQLRYTSAIVAVAALLTGFLGYLIWAATRDTSKVIALSGLVDAALADELTAQFASNDRVVLWSIVGFGLVLILSVAAMGILITHKVAGPLFQVELAFRRVRKGNLSPLKRELRKGDELKDFYAAFRDMHDALRLRTQEEASLLKGAVEALEQAGASESGSPLRSTLEQLRHLQRRKEVSLEEPNPTGRPTEGAAAPTSG